MGLDATIYADSDHSQKLKSIEIGNASMIGHLRESLGKIGPDSPILLGKVLYSGTHCGDELDHEDVQKALEEIHRVKADVGADKELQIFLRNFEDLLQTALKQRLPVVF